MRHSVSLFVLVFTLLAASMSQAAMDPVPQGTTAVPLAGITNDRDTSVSYLKLMVNHQSSVSGIYVETKANSKTDQKATSRTVYPLSRIESSKGVVLGQGQGVKAIFLRGKINSSQGRGQLVIKYLTNGVFMNYSECKVGLRRIRPDDWTLVNAYNGQPIKRIKVKTWLLGISTLANVCPGTGNSA